MRWPAFIFIAYVALGLQLGLGAVVQASVWMPSLPLLVMVFVALHAPTHATLLACFVLGLGHDAISSSALGTYAFSYGMLALCVVQLRQVMYREHPLTHLTLTLILGVCLAIAFLIQNAIRLRLAGAEAYSPGFTATLAMTVTTALLAVPVIWMLRRVRRVFAFKDADE